MNITAAPLQGYTDSIFRSAHAETIGGIDEYYMPFMRLEKGTPRKRDLMDCAPEVNRGIPVVPQILVRDPDELDFFAELLGEKGYSRIDLNFGCPFPKVVKQGYGGGILNSPEKICSLLSRCERYPEIRFSIKMRIPATDLMPVFNSIDLFCITLHPRTVGQQYNGLPDKNYFIFFQKSCRHKVVYNGDILSEQDHFTENMMLGRGLLKDPLLALKLKGFPYRNDQLKAFHDHYFQGCLELEQPLQRLKTLWDHFLCGSEKHYLKKVQKSRTLEEYSDAVETLFQNLDFCI